MDETQQERGKIWKNDDDDDDDDLSADLFPPPKVQVDGFSSRSSQTQPTSPQPRPPFRPELQECFACTDG